MTLPTATATHRTNSAMNRIFLLFASLALLAPVPATSAQQASDPQPIFLAYGAEPFDYRVAPSVAGGGLPSPNSKRLVLADGTEQSEEDCRRTMLYQLHTGDRVIDFTQGGAGVGSPLERDAAVVWADVRDELVSVESARNDYGVVVDPATGALDEAATELLRAQIKAR